MSVLKDIRLQFQSGNVLMQIIIINIFVFLVVNLISVILYFSGNNPLSLWKNVDAVVNWLAMPYSGRELLHKPWTIFTHFFLHTGFSHIFWNLVTLYFFGKLFQEYMQNKILSVYVLGALCGAFLSFTAQHVFRNLKQFDPASGMLGASAGIMAVVLATATLLPDLSIRILFIGNVTLKYVAIFFVAIDIISLPYYNNSGGHIAHLGGALFGFLFSWQLRKGKDWSKLFNRIFVWLKSLLSGKTRAKMKVAYKRKVSDEDYNYSKVQEQHKVDQILDKISRSGYESLSKEEKDFLFSASNKK